MTSTALSQPVGTIASEYTNGQMQLRVGRTCGGCYLTIMTHFQGHPTPRGFVALTPIDAIRFMRKLVDIMEPNPVLCGSIGFTFRPFLGQNSIALETWTRSDVNFSIVNNECVVGSVFLSLKGVVFLLKYILKALGSTCS